MQLNEQIQQKIEEAINLLTLFGMPKAQQNERTAYCLLSLLNMTPEKEWKNAENPLMGITPMMNFAKKYYNKIYAPNTRETFRRFSTHQMVQAGIVLYNPDDPARPVNSPNAVYQISAEALQIIKLYKTKDFTKMFDDFIKQKPTLIQQYAHERQMKMVSIKIKENHSIQISPGKHSELIRDIIEQMAPRFLPESLLVYVG